MDKTKVQPLWRRDGCVGGDCDTLYPATEYQGRTGHFAVLEAVRCDELAHQPAAHEALVFIPDDLPLPKRG